MTRHDRYLADRLDVALDGRGVHLPGELVPLVALAESIRQAALRIQPGPIPAGRDRTTCRPASPADPIRKRHTPARYGAGHGPRLRCRGRYPGMPRKEGP